MERAAVASRATSGNIFKQGILATMVLSSGMFASDEARAFPLGEMRVPKDDPAHPSIFVTTGISSQLWHQALSTGPTIIRNASIPAMSLAETRLRAEISAYFSLEEDWDGYGGEPASTSALGLLLEFLDRLPAGIEFPKVTLASSGRPSLYWDYADRFLDLEFTEDSEISLFRVLKQAETEGYFRFASVGDAASRIGEYLSQQSA